MQFARAISANGDVTGRQASPENQAMTDGPPFRVWLKSPSSRHRGGISKEALSRWPSSGSHPEDRKIGSSRQTSNATSSQRSWSFSGIPWATGLTHANAGTRRAQDHVPDSVSPDCLIRIDSGMPPHTARMPGAFSIHLPTPRRLSVPTRRVLRGSWNNGPEGRRHGMAHLAISLLARVEPGPAGRADRHGYGVKHRKCGRLIQSACSRSGCRSILSGSRRYTALEMDQLHPPSRR